MAARATASSTDQRRRLSRLLDQWECLVDPKVGLVREVQELPVDEDDPNFFHFLSTSCNAQRFTALRNFGNNGGVSSQRHVAVAKAVGEAVERYCSAIFRYADLPLASYDDLDEPATHPDGFALYTEEQHATGGIPWQPFRTDSPVSWARGVSLTSGGPMLVPAAMVYVPFHYLRDRAETPIVQPISTGLAAGASFTEAALSALCEVVERDAFTITWQARLAHPRIDAATLPGSCRDLLARYAAVGLEVKVMDITTDVGLPTMMTIALGSAATSPAVAVAAATDPSAETALVKSLEELAHTRKYAKQLMEYTPEIPDEAEAGHPQVRDQRDHLRFYCPQAAREWIRFTWSSPERRDFAEVADYPESEPAATLGRLVRDLAALGLEVAACDLTSPDVAGLGLSVVRVVVPGMHPLFMGFSNRALGSRRLYSVPQRLGHPGLEPGQPDNPYPHPFP
jgi:ribosomal protein S12 methylthiotransferase accessory factor